MSSDKRYVLKTSAGTYFECMTIIGPMFTKDVDKSYVFDNEEDALAVYALHHGFCGSKVFKLSDKQPSIKGV